MPYASQAQQGFFHANREKLESEGVNVSEWDQASKGMKLPKRAPAVNPKRQKVMAALSRR